MCFKLGALLSPALEMTGFRALPGSGLEADGMGF